MSTSSPSPAPAPSAEPEFDAKQTELIRDLANAMTWVCIPLLVIGVMYLIGAVQVFIEAFSHGRLWGLVLYLLLAGIFPLAMGVWTKRAAESFDQITQTSGRDMTHLMNALTNLRNLYGLLRAFVVAYVALLVLALILGVVTYFMMRPAAA